MKLFNECPCCGRPVYSHECMKTKTGRRTARLVGYRVKGFLINCKCGTSLLVLEQAARKKAA